MNSAAGGLTVAGAMTATQAITNLRRRLLAGLDVEERRPDLAGRSTVVLERGDGPPLVLLHGGIECGGAVWAPVVSALAECHRVVVPDLPGLGESEPAERMDGSTFDGWLQELLALTCEEQPVVVAHSLTGGLAAGFAARHGGLVRGPRIYASPGIGPYRMPLRLRALVSHVKRAMGQLLKAGMKQVRTPSCGASRFQPRCCGPGATASCRSRSARSRRQARLAAACSRGCGSRPAHRAARGLARRAGARGLSSRASL